jgi:hypothetical protein
VCADVDCLMDCKSCHDGRRYFSIAGTVQAAQGVALRRYLPARYTGVALRCVNELSKDCD